MQDRHYYCVVFNFKSSLIEIIDNKQATCCGGGIDDKCEGDVSILQQMMATHLMDIRHPAARVVQRYPKVRLVMSWQTTKNFIDCGVFLMRHMECYMGGGSRGLVTHLEKEGPAQDRQLEGLRKKYTAKILLSDCNARRGYVESEIARFYRMDQGTQAQILECANATRAVRLDKY